MTSSFRKGVIPILLLVSVFGFLAFFVVTTSFPFKDKLYSSLYPKNRAHASSTQTITFDDKQSDQELNGQYPTGVINWGNGTWIVNNSWGLFTTKNLQYNNNIKSGSFTFVIPRRVVSLEAFNGGGSTASTVTLSCPGQETKSVSVPAEKTATLATGWTNNCSPVTVGSSNGWDTSFDNLIIDEVSTGAPLPSVSPSPSPSPIPTSTPLPNASPSPKPTPTPSPVIKPTPTPTSTPVPYTTPPSTGGIWKPTSTNPIHLHWQLSQSLDTAKHLIPGVTVYDIDGFNNDASVVSTLHSKGYKAICYLSAGTWENWRPDAAQFPASVKGKSNGWPGEKWLDIRNISVIGPIMQARFDMCKQKGYDAIEPDNIDGYSNSTGFSISAQDQINYNKWLADQAHLRGLSIGLKNDVDQINALQPYFDWALNEECYQYNECGNLSAFTNANKAVFEVEYKSTSQCSSANSSHFNSQTRDLDLNAPGTSGYKRTVCVADNVNVWP